MNNDTNINTNINRQLFLGEDVTESSVKQLIEEIRKINKYDDEQEAEKKEYERKPIELIVSSFGGCAYSGFALVSTILLSKTPVHTICLGKAMSMGFLIFVAVHKRYAHRLSTFMYHEIRGWNHGELTQVKRTLEEWERLQNLYDEYVLKRTSLLKEKLDEVKEKCLDWYISAEEAKKLGIVDELLE